MSTKKVGFFDYQWLTIYKFKISFFFLLSFIPYINLFFEFETALHYTITESRDENAKKCISISKTFIQLTINKCWLQILDEIVRTRANKVDRSWPVWNPCQYQFHHCIIPEKGEESEEKRWLFSSEKNGL
jgi:hypothetical protein